THRVQQIAFPQRPRGRWCPRRQFQGRDGHRKALSNISQSLRIVPYVRSAHSIISHYANQAQNSPWKLDHRSAAYERLTLRSQFHLAKEGLWYNKESDFGAMLTGFSACWGAVERCCIGRTEDVIRRRMALYGNASFLTRAKMEDERWTLPSHGARNAP